MDRSNSSWSDENLRALRATGRVCLGVWVCMALAVGLFPRASHAATKTSTGSASWNTSGTWSPSGVPGAGDSVVIATGHTVTLNTNGTCGVLNVVGTLNYDATANRTLTMTTSSGYTGNVRISGTYGSGGTTGQVAYVAGSLFSTGTINNNAPGANALKWQFNGTGQQTTSNTGTSDDFGTLEVNSSTLTLTAQSNLVISEGLTVTAGTLALSSFTANRGGSGGTLAVSNGAALRIGGTNTFPANYTTYTLGPTSTVEYYGTAQTVTDEDYGHLTLSGSGTKTLPGTSVSVAGNFTMSGTLSATAVSAWTVSGDVTIGSGCTFGAASYSHSFGGDMTNDGTFTGSTSTVTFTGAASNTVSGSGTTTFNDVTINKGTSQANVLDVTAVITMASGGLTVTNGTFKLSSSSTITPFTADVTSSPYRIPATAGLWVNGGTVSTTNNVTWAGLIRVSSGTLNIGDATDERLLVISGSTLTVEGGALNVAGRLSWGSASTDPFTYSMSGGTFTVPSIGSTSASVSPFNISGSGSSFTMSAGTIAVRRAGGSNLGYYNIAGTTNVTGGTLQIGDASTPASQTILVDASAPVWNLTVNGANSPVAQLTNNALTVKGAVTLTSGTLNANNLNLTVAGDWTNNVSTSAYTPGTATTTLNGTNPQAVGGSFGTTFNTLTYTGNSTATLGANATINSNFTVSSGIFDLDVYTANRATSGGTLTVSSGAKLMIGGTNGFPTNYTTNTLSATGTVEYDGTTQSVAVKSYGHLTISGSATKTLAGTTTPAGNLTVSAGTFDLSTFTCNRSSGGGTLTVSNGATLKIGGTNGFPTNYTTNTLGATSTVEYAGSTQSVGAQTYGHLTISAAGTKTLAGTATVAGDLTVSAGTYALSTFTCSRASAGGTITISNGASLTIGSTNPFPANFTTATLGATSTVDYTGTTQTVATLNYGHLTLSTSNTKTLASGTTGIAGTFTISGSASANCTTNSTTVSYNGTGAQSVLGITYHNLTIDKASGTATLAATATVNSDLSVSLGTLDLSTFTANRASGGGTITVANGATLKIGGTNGFPTNYTTATLGATSTVEYAGSTQPVGAKTYGHLTLSAAGTKTLAGTATVAGDLTVAAGTYDLSTFTCDRAPAGGTITVSNGATLKIGGTNGFPTNYTTNTLGATSTVEYGGTTQTVSVQSYGHLTLSGSATKTLAGTVTPAGDLTVSAGTFDLSTFTCNRASGGGTITVSNGATLKIGSTNGFPTNYTTATLGATSTVEYGGTAQTVAALAYGSLTTSGGSTKTLAGDASVAGTLTLTSGNIATGANTLTLTAAGSVSRTSGHVVGNLKKNVATGAPSRTFEIGDGSNYTPLTVAFGSVSVAGDLTATTAGADHANIASSTIVPSLTANRTWSLTNSGITFDAYSATFNFVSGDLDAGAATGSFIVGKYSGASWSYPTVGTRTSTSTQVTGVTAFSDFEVGEPAVYSVAATTGAFSFGTSLANAWLTAQSSLLTNDGNVAANLVGQITQFTDGTNTWNVDGSNNGANTLRAQWSATSSTGPWTDIGAYDADFTVASAVAASGTATIWLRIMTPTTTTSYSQYASTLKVFAR